MAKTALIVDDSASARVVLSRILAEYELDVDTAESAEQALEYLSSQRPDVIFMDHLMPGMDGFQAVQAIKANPDTATIPIMMYTSQEGELYVGQARALGAVGVLPKQVKPVEVSKVLTSLGLIHQEPLPDADTETPLPEAPRDADIEALLKDLFQQQRGLLREEIRDGYQQLEFERSGAHEAMVVATRTGRDRTGPLVGAVALAITGIAVWFAYLYWETQQRWQTANARNDRLLETLEQQRTAIQMQVSRQSAAQSVDLLLDALQWGANEAGHYGFGRIPLDDYRAQLLSGLLQRLESAGFRGVVQVDSHVGRYCFDQQPDGVDTLAAPDTPVAQCNQLGWTAAEAAALGERQTLTFANTVAAANSVLSNGLSVIVISHGSTQPLAEYPPQAAGLIAGDWNQVADLNNRVEITLLPE